MILYHVLPTAIRIVTLDTANLIGNALAITAVPALVLAPIRMIQTETHLVIVHTWMNLTPIGRNLDRTRRGRSQHVSATATDVSSIQHGIVRTVVMAFAGGGCSDTESVSVGVVRVVNHAMMMRRALFATTPRP